MLQKSCKAAEQPCTCDWSWSVRSIKASPTKGSPRRSSPRPTWRRRDGRCCCCYCFCSQKSFFWIHFLPSSSFPRTKHDENHFFKNHFENMKALEFFWSLNVLWSHFFTLFFRQFLNTNLKKIVPFFPGMIRVSSGKEQKIETGIRLKFMMP